MTGLGGRSLRATRDEPLLSLPIVQIAGERWTPVALRAQPASQPTAFDFDTTQFVSGVRVCACIKSNRGKSTLFFFFSLSLSLSLFLKERKERKEERKRRKKQRTRSACSASRAATRSAFAARRRAKSACNTTQQVEQNQQSIR